MSQKICKPDMIMFDWDHTLSVTPLMFNEEYTKSMYNFYVNLLGEEAVSSYQFFEFSSGLPVYANDHLKTVGEMRSFMMPGMAQVLDFLLANEIPMAVVSNKINCIVNYEVHSMDLSHYFCSIVGSEDHTIKKPDPDLLLTTASRCNIPFDAEVWYVGDSLVDMQAANAAGYTSIYYRYSSPSHESAMDYRSFITQYERTMLNSSDWRPDYIIDDLSELLYLVQDADNFSYVGEFKDK